MNKRHYEHTLPNIRGSLSNTYVRCNHGVAIYLCRKGIGYGKEDSMDMGNLVGGGFGGDRGTRLLAVQSVPVRDVYLCG